LLCLVPLLGMTAPWGVPSALAASAPVIELIPEVQGVAPSGQGAGFGVEFQADPNGTGLASFSLTLTPGSPTDAEILNSYCPSGYSCSGSTDPTSGSSTISVSGASISAPKQLGFFEVKITAPIGQLVPMTLTVTSATDTTGASLPLPAPVTFNLERGAVLNTVSGSPSTAQPIGQSDITAALSYLSGSLSAGSAAGEVNPINMASLVPPGSTLPNAPGPANAWALLQYLNGQRDAYLAESPPKTVSVTASPSQNLYGVNLDLSPAVPGLILQNVAVIDSSGNSVPLTNLTASNGGFTYALDLSSTSNGLSYGATYTVYIGTGTNGTTATPGLDFPPVTLTTPQAPPTPITATVSGVSTSGFTLSMGVDVPLVAGDLTLRDPAGNSMPITSLETMDTGATYLVQAALTAGESYALTITASGYSFGEALAVSVPQNPVPVTVTINPQASDLLLTTSPILPNLPSADVHITDASGNPVGGVSAAPIYGGSTVMWEVYGDVVDSQSYALNLSVPGYAFSPAIPFVMPMGNYVNVTATPLSTSEVQFVLSQPETGLTASDLTLTGPNGAQIAVAGLTTSDGGQTYQVTASLTRGDTYALAISAPATHATFYTTDFTLPAPITAAVAGVFDGGFTIQLGSPLDLSASSFTVTDSLGNTFAPSSVASTNDLVYTVDAPLAPGKSYTVSIRPPLSDETFNPATPLAVDLPGLTATPAGVTTNGFSLTLSLPVPGLAPSAFTVTDTATNTTIPLTSANTGDGGLTYAIDVPLAVGQSYALQVFDGTSSYTLGTIALPTMDLTPEVSGITPAGFDVSWGASAPTLTASDVTLTVSGSNVPIPVNVAWSGNVMLVTPASGMLAPATDYSLTLAFPGYAFGSALAVDEPVVGETATIENVTTSGFTLALAPALPGLTAGALSLGTGSTLVLGASTDGGATYPVTVSSPSITPGTEATLTIAKSGYAFSTFPTVYLAPISVTGTVYGIQPTQVSVSFNPALPGLDAPSVSLTDVTTGAPVPIGSFSSSDGGSTYTLALASGSSFVGGSTGKADSFALTLSSGEYALTSPMTFTGVVPATVEVSGISPTGFDITTSPAVPLSASDLTVSGNGAPVPVASFNPGTGLVSAALSGGVTYAVYVSAPGYAFTDPAPFTLQVAMNPPSHVTATGLTLSFSAPLPGLTTADVTVTQITPVGGAVPVQTLTASDSSYRYDVSFGTDGLSPGDTYQVSVALPGFSLGPPVDATVPDISVGAAVYDVTSAGFDLSLTPSDPTLTPGDLSVTTGGASVSATLGTSSDGVTYPVTAQLTPGDTYTITLTQWGYSFNSGSNTATAYLPPETVSGSVYNQSTTGLTLALSPAVDGLTAGNLQISGPDGPVPITSLFTSDGGSTYAISATLPPDTYTIYITSTSANLTTPVTFTVSPVSVTAAIDNVSPDGFQLSFSPDLPQNQILTYTLTDTTQNSSLTQSFETTGASAYTILDGLTSGDAYTLAPSLGGYAFSGPAAFTVPGISNATAVSEAVDLETSSPPYSQDEVALILDGEGYTPAEIAKGLTGADASMTISDLMGSLQDIGLTGSDLPAALLTAFSGETDLQMADLLIGAGYDPTSVAAGLKSAHSGETGQDVASALQSAGVSSAGIMEALVNVYGDAPSSTVPILQALGTTASGIIQALEVYGYGLDGAAAAMEAGGFSATALVPALETDFSLTFADPALLASALEQAGYTATEAAAGLKAGGVTDAGMAIVTLIGAGYSASSTAEAVTSATTYSATASQVAANILGDAPGAVADLSVLIAAGFADEATWVIALEGAGFNAASVAAAAYAQDPSGISTLGTDLTSAGYTFGEALGAIDGLAGGNDTTAVIAAWPSIFGSGGSLVTASTAAGNLKSAGPCTIGAGCSAAQAAPLLETVYPTLAANAASLATALLGGGYAATDVAPILRAWYLTAGAGSQADLLAGEALGGGGATPVAMVSTMHDVFGDTASTAVAALEEDGVTSTPTILSDLGQAGFGLTDVTAQALRLVNDNPDAFSPMMHLAGFSASQTLAAYLAYGGQIDAPQAIAMLASSLAGSGGAFDATDIASALEATYGTDAQTAATELLGPNLPFGVGDVGAALESVYGASPKDLVSALEANGIEPYTVLLNAQCRLGLVCTLETTFGLSAPQALRVLGKAASLSDGTIYNVISAVFTTYAITTTSAQEAALAEAGYPLLTIASYLNQVDQISIASVILALRQGGYSAAEVASYLKADYGDSDGGAAATLLQAGYSLDDIVVGLESAYGDASTLFVTLVEYSIATASDAAAAIASASGTGAALSVAQGEASYYNYDAAQIAQSLSVTFGETPTAIAGILKEVGFGAGDTVTGLKEALDLSAPEAVALLGSVIGITSPAQEVAALWQNGGAYGTYQPSDIAAGLGTTDPVQIASDMLAGGVDPALVEGALTEVFAPGGAIDNPLALAGDLNKLGAASFSEGAASILLTGYGLSGAEQVALLWAGGYTLEDVATAAMASIPANSANYFGALYQIFHEVSTCTGGTASLGTCTSGTSTFTPTDAADAYPGASPNEAGLVASEMAGAGYTMGEIASALTDPAGVYKLPLVPTVYLAGDPTVYNESLVSALYEAGYTPGEITPLVAAAPYGASPAQIAEAYLNSNDGVYGSDVANSLAALPGSSREDAAQAMEDAGYSAVQVGEVLIGWGYSMPHVYYTLSEVGYGWDLLNVMLQLYAGSPQQVEQLVESAL